MRFISVDFETANVDLASVCQIGVVTFSGGQVRSTWTTLVDPEDSFDSINTSIHGIDEGRVRGAPTFPAIAAELRRRVEDEIVVSYSWFDRVALEQASEKYGLVAPPCRWLDGMRVVRRTWPERFARRGYGLASVAEWCGIEFEHHRADEDARAAGQVFLQAVAHSGVTVEAWLQRAQEPISTIGRKSIKGNPEGPLFGETIVFTGALSMPRREAAAMAAEAGCQVGTAVTKKTTLVVVGQQDLRRLASRAKSSKHRKAEGLIAQGHPVRILGENDFRRLVALV